jgi:ABC-2 type transport system ATP-binding protein
MVSTAGTDAVGATSATADSAAANSAAAMFHTDGSELIALRRLHRFFGTTRAVNDVSFSIPRGQVFGYIGPNGAGKTTSMRILATLDLPTYGDAVVDGFSVINDPDRVRRRLGFMPDYFGTYANVNCREYLDFYARAYGLVGRERHRALNHVMGFTNLDKLAEKPISGLSKGMKQRLCLGRAMIHNPAVLILDEPAAGLDPRARIELREMIGQLAAGEGKTVLISSHILTELAEMSDRIGIIEKGELLATGTVEEIRLRLGAHREVRVRLLGRGLDAGDWLKQQPGVTEVVCQAGEVRFSHGGEPVDEARMLRQLIEAGFDVTEFRSEEKSLEEVFMHVTQGVVQ